MKKIIFLMISCFLYNIVYAQDTDQILKKLVEKNVLTQTEADELSASQSKKMEVSSADKVRQLFSSPYIQLGGYGQLMYKYSDASSVHHDFKAKNLFLSVNGKLNDSFRYGFLIEFINPSVQEFWGEWTAASEFNFKAG